MANNQPVSYTSKDYLSLRQAMFDDARAKLPAWTSRDTNDFGVVLIEEFAYMGDIISWYIDRAANEAYLPTATLRQSLLNIAATLDYRPDNGRPSTVTLSITVAVGNGRILIPAGSQFSTTITAVIGSTPVPLIFETDSDLYIDQSSTIAATGTVTATQGFTVSDEAVGSSDGTDIQSFALANSPVIEVSVGITVNEGGSGPTVWNFVEYLIDAGPSDPVFTTTTDAQGVTRIIFGDDVNGRVPTTGAVITATYRVGGGVSGNTGPGTITQMTTPLDSVTSVTNLVSAGAGSDPETDDQIRINAPASLKTLHRAVSLEDYSNLCLLVSGVAKAKAYGLTYTSIVIWVAPIDGGFVSDVVKNRITQYLGPDKVMTNAHITLEDPIYVPINITALISIADQYAQSTVITAAQNALALLLDFTNVDFGQRVSLDAIYATLAAVPGVVYSTVEVLARSSDTDQGCADVALNMNEIPTLSGGSLNLGVTEDSGGISGTTGGVSGGDLSRIPGPPGTPVIDSLSCGLFTHTLGEFNLEVHWTAGVHATGYNVLVDFFTNSDGTGYLGTSKQVLGPVLSALVNDNAAGPTAAYYRVRIQSVNGYNTADSLATAVLPFPCNTEPGPLSGGGVTGLTLLSSGGGSPTLSSSGTLEWTDPHSGVDTVSVRCFYAFDNPVGSPPRAYWTGVGATYSFNFADAAVIYGPVELGLGVTDDNFAIVEPFAATPGVILISILRGSGGYSLLFEITPFNGGIPGTPLYVLKPLRED